MADVLMQPADADSTPRVSVVIAARNAADTLARAMASILTQSFGATELLVVDDGSDDSTGDVAAAVGDARVRVIRLARSVGRGGARNVAIEQASAEVVAILDADDVARPGRLQETLDLFDADPEAVVVGGQARFISPHGVWRLRRYPLDDAAIRSGLSRGDMTVCHPASAIRRSALAAVGGYRSDYSRAQDLDLMRRLTPFGRFANSGSDFIDYHHSVLLPYRYWRETRHNALGATHGIAPAETRARSERARYAAAMGRRATVFARTYERIR